VALGQLAELLGGERPRRGLGDPGLRQGPQVGGALAVFQRCSLAHHRAWSYLPDRLPVDPDLEVPVQDQRQRRARLGLAEQELPGGACLPGR